MAQGAVKTPGKRSQAVSAKKQAILSAALETFSQFGIHGTRLEQVAEQSRVSKTNLLYYYPSKEALCRGDAADPRYLAGAAESVPRGAGPAGGDQRVHTPEAGGVARLPAGITAVLS
jgi:AcrR family transcriptional regulator